MTKKPKTRVYVDLDGVTVDFARYMREHGLTGDEVKKQPGAYLMMHPIPGAIEAIRSIIGMGYDVHIATKPPTGIPFAYADKVAWVLEHLPELSRKMTLTHDKGQLGGPNDYLIDDRPHKANCEAFAGKLVPFVPGMFEWPQILELLRGTPQVVVTYRSDGTDNVPVWCETPEQARKCFEEDLSEAFAGSRGCTIELFAYEGTASDLQQLQQLQES
jgi:5'(3')-deoxyribonucleotidase